MNPPDNPFAFDDMGPGSSPFGKPDQVVCCKCGGTVAREDASFKVKSGPSWVSILFWGPFWGLIMGDDHQERGYYCPLCLQLFRREQRRQKILVIIAAVIIGILFILMEFI